MAVLVVEELAVEVDRAAGVVGDLHPRLVQGTVGAVFTAAALTVGALTAVIAVLATAAGHHRAQRPNAEISDVQYDSPGA
ncbi:hypothetical protein ABZ841_30080 [Streptomyces flaveolus]